MRDFEKATYRGFQGHWLRNLPNLSREEAKHYLLFDAHGRELLRATGGTIDELAGHLVEASKRGINKREAPTTMSSTERILKNVRSMGEAEYTRIVTNYAKQQYPELSRERAFAKVFEDPDSTAI